MAEFLKIAQTSDIPEGTCKVVEANGKTIAVFNVSGDFHAIDNTCLHQGGPLGEGQLNGNIVTCPWHAWQYDVTSGISPVNPTVRLSKFEIRVENDDVMVSV